MKNSNSNSFKRWLAVAGVALAVPLSAMAYPGEGGKHAGKMGGCDGHDGMRGAMKHGGGMGMHTLRGLHRLDLNEAQQDRIFELMHAQAPAMRNQMKELRNSEAELQAVKTAADFSESRAKALIDKIARQRAEMDMARLQTERKVLDVLTPEQRRQLAEMKPGMPPGKRDGRGPAN